MGSSTPRETEAQLQERVVDLARACGWLVHHARPGRTAEGWRTPIQGHAGFPDLVLVGRGRLLFIELKSERGKVRAEQTAWLNALSVHAEVNVWTPSMWPQIEQVLKSARAML